MDTIEQLIDIILTKSEQLEEHIKQISSLKDLTIRQLICINLIHELNNPTVSELANGLKITKPSTTVLIDRLAEKDFVTKAKSDDDRRLAHVHLTAKGAEIVRLHADIHKQFAELLTQNFTESEKVILAVLLNKALKSMT